MHPLNYLPTLLGIAWLAPLAAFTIIVLAGPRLGKKMSSYVSILAIGLALVLSFISFALWLSSEGLPQSHHHAAHEDAEHGDAGHGDAGHDDAGHDDEAETEHAAAEGHGSDHGEHHDDSQRAPTYVAGNWYKLNPPGLPTIGVGYYIDALTVCMFCMVTFIATCIHVYALGYMHDELEEFVDHEVTLGDGHHLHRPGRFHRFFQYLSLFCFSMLGLVIAGNIFMVFMFWELVGVCSYFLIGFYIERKSASNAANKAFIVNRVGDFGMLIGLMALWASLGTFAFGDRQEVGEDGQRHVALTEQGTVAEPGIFSQVRPASSGHRLLVPDGMVMDGNKEEVAIIMADHGANSAAARSETLARVPEWRKDKEQHYGYWLLVVAGLGIFCGCVGKSAQFPLHVWLPDAMEGPTPVSALVHSATMVAAGVYLVGRFFPVFTPEVLLVIASIGAITLFLAATIAITATDIKRVLAYSTVSQLGYMMLALGVGGWVAGLFHLITHAFFKSLLFMCSGSVIHACHTNEMTQMGGLRKKMPYTAYTMLVGCLAIAGAPFFSGFFSKDAIVAQTILFGNYNSHLNVFFYVAAVGAAITAFYMFRLWYMTFAGKPRDEHVWHHVHESPKVMYVPLIILAVMAVSVGWRVPFTENFSVTGLLEMAQPAGTGEGVGAGVLLTGLTYPAEHLSHEAGIHLQATAVASGTALAGFLLATVMYLWGLVNPVDVRNQFSGVYRFLRNKWYFDELYDVIFVRPVHVLGRFIAGIDRGWIDWLLDSSARWVRGFSNWGDSLIDRTIVDGLVNLIGGWIYGIGAWLRNVQTGRLRQYVVFIVVGLIGLFVLISFWANAVAGLP